MSKSKIMSSAALLKAREILGYSQQELSSRIHRAGGVFVSQGAVSDVETNLKTKRVAMTSFMRAEFKRRSIALPGA